MESIEKVLVKLKEARKEKGLSQENMAIELGISQGAYTNIENNESKLTVERLLQIAQILEKHVFSFFELVPFPLFNQDAIKNPKDYQTLQTIYQENKETLNKLLSSYEERIKELQQEVNFLRKQTIR